jgi:competence protein ComGC
MSRSTFRRGFTLTEILAIAAVLVVLVAILFPVLARVREKGRQATCLSNQHQVALAILGYALDHEGRLPTADTVWTALDGNTAVLGCPSDVEPGHNSYGYNSILGGKPLARLAGGVGPLRLSPDRCVLTADCQSGAENELTSREDLALRHGRIALASYLDGHAAVAQLEALPAGAADAGTKTLPHGVDIVPPSITIGSPLVVERTSSVGTPVALATPQVSDNMDPTPTVSNDAPALFPLGAAEVVWTARDRAGNSSKKDQQVIVRDTTPPRIRQVDSRFGELWPPNHRMVGLTITVNATDTCPTPPTARIVQVRCTEPTDGRGDGHTGADWEITGPLTLNVRAERSGTLSGRVYTVTLECTDTCGNTTMKEVQLTVPHDLGQ